MLAVEDFKAQAGEHRTDRRTLRKLFAKKVKFTLLRRTSLIRIEFEDNNPGFARTHAPLLPRPPNPPP